MDDEEYRRRQHERCREVAKEARWWGPVEILLFHFAAHTAEVFTFGEPHKPRKRRIKSAWKAVAYIGDRRVADAGRYHKKRDALANVRAQLRRKMDNIPARIERLEADYAVLMEALR